MSPQGNAYSFKDYLKDDWRFLLRFYIISSWGFMLMFAGNAIIEQHHMLGSTLYFGGFVWLVLLLIITKPRCF